MAQIKCPECGNEISSLAKSCPNCGCPINSGTEKSNQSENRCQECGEILPPDANKCPKCGCPTANYANFAKSSLLPNERILCSAKWHGICYVGAFLLGIASLIFFILWIRYLDSWYEEIAWTAYFPLFIILGLFSVYGIIAIKHNEFVVTNRRILVKNGIIMRASYELRLEKLESIQVYQSVLGRILGYGLVMVHGVGASRRIVWGLESPLEFRQHIFAELNKINNEKCE